MDGSLADRLVRLGLTGYEARAYVALTRRDRATGAELARLARLPRQRIYDVMDGLVARGFATVRAGRPSRYTAAAPQEAVQRLLEERKAELADLERDAEHAIERLTPTFAEGRDTSDPLDFIEVLREPRSIAARFAELQSEVESEILVFTKPPFATPPAENIEGLRLLRRRSARSVYERSIFDYPEHVEAVEAFLAAGEQARVAEKLPLKLAIMDERVAMFEMEDPVAGGDNLTIMVVEHPALAGVLKIAFEAVWATAVDFAEAASAHAATAATA
jgi:HTH-type transcriptional regulator, sugar sensing transcriptional regulator